MGHALLPTVAARRFPRDFRLGNAEDRSRSAPDTFVIPTRAEREAFVPGDLVKLIFEIVDDNAEASAERMWVEIVEARDRRYVGTLDNLPRVITTVGLGDPVSFGPEHITAFSADR